MVVAHLGWVLSDAGSSPGKRAVTTAICCPTGEWNIPNLSKPNPGARPPTYVIRLNSVARFLTDRGRVEQRLLPDERDRAVPVVDARSEERLGKGGLDVTVPRLEGDLSPGRRLGSSRNVGFLIVPGEIVAWQNLNL